MSREFESRVVRFIYIDDPGFLSESLWGPVTLRHLFVLIPFIFSLYFFYASARITMLAASIVFGVLAALMLLIPKRSMRSETLVVNALNFALDRVLRPRK